MPSTRNRPQAANGRQTPIAALYIPLGSFVDPGGGGEASSWLRSVTPISGEDGSG